MKQVFVQTFGCQMNASDSDRMKATVAPLGYEPTLNPENADLVLINTCSIREKAENKLFSSGYELAKYKKNNPNMKIGVTGCVAQQEKDKILKELPFVDLVIGPDNIDELPWILEELSHEKQVIRTDFDEDPRIWKTTTKILNPGATAFISVMKGCDHFCSYCIVPYTRGREKSRPIADVITDVRDLVSRGVREITFLGQNINTYGKRTGESLGQLFRAAHEIENLERIRFTTSHPGDIKDELIRCFEDLPKLNSYFHLPVQSGSNRILRGMRRFYTREQYLDRVQSLRQARPDIAFSTDIIIGFPGETEEDFQQTLELVEQVRFDNSYSFIFSPRPGTAAALRPDSTTEHVKMDRLTTLQNLLRKISKEQHEAEVGKTHSVLVEGLSKKDATKITGRTSQNVPVHVDVVVANGVTLKAGDMIEVEILEGALTNLKGRYLSHKSHGIANGFAIATPSDRSHQTQL